MFKFYVRTCIRCIENEADIDDYLTPSEYRNRFWFPKIPRVPKWVAHWEKRKMTFFILYFLLMLCWLVGGGVFYLLIKHSVYIYKKIKSLRFKVNQDSKNDVILFLENNTSTFVNSHTKSQYPKTWLVPPRYNSECKRIFSDKDKYLDVESVVSFVDILYCFVVSLVALYMCPLRTKLQWYAIPDCVLTQMALSRINPGSLTCTAHFDRWAVMVNDFCEKKDVYYRLIQHGSIKGIASKTNQHYYITNKLTAVNELIVYDDVEKELMLEHVIDSKHVPANIFFAKPDFDLDKKVQGDILFVGHPLYETLHVAIFHSLALDTYKVYYKEHPKAQATQSIRNIGWALVEDKNSFPDVDFVISYHSTLALMYENVGATVFIHENEEVNSSEYISFINKIRKSLRHQ